MDDSKLRALLTAVQCGSFGKAAVQLGYTQSAMTHLVSKLEAELGCTLLLRSSKGVCLSEEGEHLLPYIHGVINACDALRQEAEEQGEVYGRALRIGCFASIARASLPELLRKFRKLHPEIKVDVLVAGQRAGRRPGGGPYPAGHRGRELCPRFPVDPADRRASGGGDAQGLPVDGEHHLSGPLAARAVPLLP